MQSHFGNHTTNLPRKWSRTIFYGENHPYFLRLLYNRLQLALVIQRRYCRYSSPYSLVIGESIALNHLLRFVSEIAPHNKRGLYFSIYGIHWDISRTCGPVIGAVLLSNLNGSMLFYICASFLINWRYCSSTVCSKFRT